MKVIIDFLQRRFDAIIAYFQVETKLVKVIDLKTDNLDRVSIPRKIVATFDVEHLIHETTYGPK